MEVLKISLSAPMYEISKLIFHEDKILSNVGKFQNKYEMCLQFIVISI